MQLLWSVRTPQKLRRRRPQPLPRPLPPQSAATMRTDPPPLCIVSFIHPREDGLTLPQRSTWARDTTDQQG